MDVGSGGGIFAFGSDLNITDSRFDHCEGDDGGAAYLVDSVTVIVGCSFESNLATEYAPVAGLGPGGALALSENLPGTLWIERSVFFDNLATGSPAAASGNGGAVLGPAFLSHVSTSGNVAADAGGALAGALSVDHCYCGPTFRTNGSHPGASPGAMCRTARPGPTTSPQHHSSG